MIVSVEKASGGTGSDKKVRDKVGPEHLQNMRGVGLLVKISSGAGDHHCRL